MFTDSDISPDEVIGDHMLDVTDSEMQTLLLARGPAFRAGIDLPIRNFTVLDVYPLISTVLGIPLRPNNGSLARAMQLLIHSQDQPYVMTSRDTSALVGQSIRIHNSEV